MASILVLACYLVLSVSLGYSILVRTLRWDASVPVALRFGAAYFTGMAFVVAVVRTIAAVGDRADIAAWITLALGVAISLSFRKALGEFFVAVVANRKFLYVVSATLVFGAASMINWLPGNENPDNPFAIIGSLHSVRYVWIANRIAECLQVPVLGQNTGQSILVFVLGQFGGHQPFLLLNMLLTMSAAALGAFLYGLVSLVEAKPSRALMATLIVLAGGTALSVTHVLVVDSGSPFLFSGYTDSLFGVFSVLMLLLCHAALKRPDCNKPGIFLLTAVLCINNFFMAPQNMVFLGAMLPVMVIAAFRTDKQYGALMFWTCVLLVSAVIAIPQGGMLTPGFFRSTLNYAGLMTPVGAGKAGIQIVPGVPFQFGSMAGWTSGQGALLKEAQGYMADARHHVFNLIFIFEQVLWASIRVLFFPILGLVVWYRLSRTVSNSKSAAPANKLVSPIATQQYLTAGVMVFVLGLGISFLIQLNGFKWELSRFLIPGITLGMFGLALSAVAYSRNRGSWVMAGVLVIVVIGPVLSLATNVGVNVISWAAGKQDDRRISAFLSAGPTMEGFSCQTR